MGDVTFNRLKHDGIMGVFHRDTGWWFFATPMKNDGVRQLG